MFSQDCHMLTHLIHELPDSGRVSVSLLRKLMCTEVKSLALGSTAARLEALLSQGNEHGGTAQ